jgi:SAM-dependent methyltransferase
MTSDYFFDPANKVHGRQGSETFTYSDGEEVEVRLLNAIERAKDLSTVSEELANEIVDWPSEYHLSCTRHNLLRPIGIGPNHKVLELGCGCGAMTRYLGEAGATVVAVEGSKRRAQIAASRCRDLPNVTIYCDNLIDFHCDEKFDFVTLIGVLEYSPKFIESNDPVARCLGHAQSFLNIGGALILAIENQLGLKYFNGCLEDHVGIPYFGINDLYGDANPVTLGRHELSEKLGAAGFPTQEFFYPFPDYKLPRLVLSEEALSDSTLNLADLLVHNSGRNYPETHHRAFAENLAWRALIRNRLVPDLANSFLVIARISHPNQRKIDWLAKMYSRGHRQLYYQVESIISTNPTGQLVVRKRKLFPYATERANTWLDHVVADSTYLPGNLFLVKIHEAMAREASITDLATLFKPWLELLLDRATTDKDGAHILPGDFIDCIPANVIESPTGDLHYFDAEWVSRTNIPLSWVLIRGIVDCVHRSLGNRSVKMETYRSFISKIASNSGISLDERDFSIADEWESRLSHLCHADSESAHALSRLFDEQLHLLDRFRPDLEYQLNRHEIEIMRIKNTFSWRVTAPLRVVWNMLFRVHKGGAQ